MRERDERLASLTQTQAEEIHRAALRDNPVNVAARGDDAGGGLSRRTIHDTLPPAAVDGSAMTGLPPRDTDHRVHLENNILFPKARTLVAPPFA